MKIKNWLAAAVEVVLWGAFFYYFLYAIKNPVSLLQSAVILVGIMYAACLVCPLLRATSAWKRLWHE